MSFLVDGVYSHIIGRSLESLQSIFGGIEEENKKEEA
jgi:hypothetical protein